VIPALVAINPVHSKLKSRVRSLVILPPENNE
jgi:hypothetical protein